MPPTSYLQAVQTYQVVQLDPTNAPSYRELTYPRYRRLLNSMLDPSIVAIGAEIEGSKPNCHRNMSFSLGRHYRCQSAAQSRSRCRLMNRCSDAIRFRKRAR